MSRDWNTDLAKLGVVELAELRWLLWGGNPCPEHPTEDASECLCGAGRASPANRAWADSRYSTEYQVAQDDKRMGTTREQRRRGLAAVVAAAVMEGAA